MDRTWNIGESAATDGQPEVFPRLSRTAVFCHCLSLEWTSAITEARGIEHLPAEWADNRLQPRKLRSVHKPSAHCRLNFSRPLRICDARNIFFRLTCPGALLVTNERQILPMFNTSIGFSWLSVLRRNRNNCSALKSLLFVKCRQLLASSLTT